MSLYSKHTTSNLIPCVRYRDVPAALEWLCKAFDFEQLRVVEDDEAGIIHAQLGFGSGMLMLGPVTNPAPGHDARQSEQGGDVVSTYVIVNSADALYARAKAAGAGVVSELKDEDHGGRSFTCHDLEGHLWTFGTYDPWAEQNALQEDR